MPPTYSELKSGFKLGPWKVLPDRGLLEQGDIRHHVEPLVMDVLLVLASNQGQVVSKDQLVEKVWRGRATADDAITAKISALRSKLGDDSKHPVYVETVQKRGYRLKSSVELRTSEDGKPVSSLKLRIALPILVAGLSIAVFAAYTFWPRNDPIDSVAVLQFRNLSDDKEKYQYMADGFSEELVVSLDQVPNLRFTRGPGASSSDSLQTIADELDVDVVISGSLRTDGNKIRITVEMISANGFQIWADRIDGASKDIFSIQERVASQVRSKLLGERGHTSQVMSRPVNSDAFDFYMRGLFFLAKRDVASLEQARALFEETITFDPAFGPAYLRQAITLILLADYAPEKKGELYDLALAIADRGTEADPGIQESIQLIYGFVHHQRGNWAEAADAYATALQAVTVYPDAFHWHARFLGDIGFADQALSEALTAREMEPASQILNSRVAVAYLWRGDMVNAALYFRVANAMGVGVPDHHFGYAIFLLRDGRVEEARESAKIALALAQVSDRWVDPVFDSLANPADAELRSVAISFIDAIAADGSIPPYLPMTLWSLFGQSNRMMQLANEWPEDAGVIKNLELIYQDEFKSFRQEPDFPRLLDKLGLTRYWSNIGCKWSADHVVCGTVQITLTPVPEEIQIA